MKIRGSLHKQLTKKTRNFVSLQNRKSPK